MKLSVSTALLLGVSFAPAIAHPTAPSAKFCTTYSIPITTTSNNWIWGYPLFIDNFDVANFISDVEARVSAPDFHPVIGRANVTASYSIGATFCTPKAPSDKSKTVLLATHGVGFDRSYWDLQIPGAPENSFTDYAIAKGYSVFFYDRLGVGESDV
jgi:pimeloyl-ACP methyl ester carboxylesterase